MATNIKDKIAKLLALAESPNENEARAALLKARELMAEHKLRPEEIKKAEKAKVIRDVLDVTCTSMTNPWACSLSAVIAAHYCCRAYRTQKFAGSRTVKIGLVGLEEDFEIAKRIFLYAYDCVMSYIKREIKKDPTDPPGTYREKCNAYGWGFVQGVKAAFEKQDEENREWGLVLVVPQAVDDSMKDMGKASTSAASMTTTSAIGPRATRTGRSSTRRPACLVCRSGLRLEGDADEVQELRSRDHPNPIGREKRRLRRRSDHLLVRPGWSRDVGGNSPADP